MFLTESGSKITLPIGWILSDNRISLNKGIDIEGAYWQNLDRLVNSFIKSS